MSSLSIKSHKRSMTSWTCFMHLPWNEHHHSIYKKTLWNLINDYCQNIDKQCTHGPVTEANGTGFAFAEVKIWPFTIKGSAQPVFFSTAHFTWVFSLWKTSQQMDELSTFAFIMEAKTVNMIIIMHILVLVVWNDTRWYMCRFCLHLLGVLCKIA